MSRLNPPILSTTLSLLALFSGILAIVSTRYLPERESIQAFFVLVPTTLILASSGYILSVASYRRSRDRRSLIGFFVGGGVCVAFVVVFLLM
jgi:heme/copper-type cytochrome/quinol oxidase subunit 3